MRIERGVKESTWYIGVGFQLLVRGIRGEVYNMSCGSFGPDNLYSTRRRLRSDLVLPLWYLNLVQTTPHHQF